MHRCSSKEFNHPTAPDNIAPDPGDDGIFVRYIHNHIVATSPERRLDLRGHKIRSLSSGGMNLSSNLEVLDLSFKDFKGPGFEPLGNCKQLYLAENQVTSLKSLPELPNLEVLAANKNKISTLKGFPHLPALEGSIPQGNSNCQTLSFTYCLVYSNSKSWEKSILEMSNVIQELGEINPDFRNLDIKELCAAANTDANTDEDIDEEADDCEDDNLVDNESHDTDDQ
ncbi:hypothetical protein OROHE_014166 [Orobanche hederae]